MGLAELREVPERVRQTADVIAGLDRCLLVGFGRLGPEQAQALQGLQRIFTGTPLERAVSEAVAALGRNEFVEHHFGAVAAARAALQGAQYDALRAQAAAALGRPAPDGQAGEAAAAVAVPEPVRVWQESTRHWLMELALAGFAQLEPATLVPFQSTLEQLQAEPLTGRLAALLTGFLNELLASLPVSALPGVPVHRWADLWTRAVVGSLRPPPPLAGRKVSGPLALLGADLRHHNFFVSADLYGLLTEGETRRLVRVTLSSFTVDVVHGAELWRCLAGPKTTPLLQALAEHGTLNVRDATLLPTGDLFWDGEAKSGKAAPFPETAARHLAPAAEAPPLTPRADALDRHPVQVAEPVYLDGYEAAAGDPPTLSWGDGATLPVALERLSHASELQAEHVANSKGLLGLLRFDGGRWLVQPLAAVLKSGKQPLAFTGSGAYEIVTTPPKKKGDTLTILRERAGKLLRKKS